MRLKLLGAVLLSVLAFPSVRLLNAFILAKDVAGPHTSTREIFRRAVHSPYEIKVPHRSFLANVRFSLVPEASACGTGTPFCNGTVSKQTCNSNCPLGICGYCPDCTNGPCTIYSCQPGPPNRFCQDAGNPNKNCSLCDDASNSTCISAP